MAAVLGICLVAQIVVWGAVHFSELRKTELKAPVVDRPATVVVSSGMAMAEPAVEPARSLVVPQPVTEDPSDSTRAVAEQPVATRVPPPIEQVNPNIVPARGDWWMRSFATIVQTVGIMAALMLMILLFQGVTISGGGGVPGVEMAVTAMSWGLVIGLLCLPLRGILPGVAYGGVFESYAALVEASEAYRAGLTNAPSGLEIYGLRLALPILLLAGLVAVVIRFYIGIERGILVTNISQLDEKLEREIRAMKLGALAMPRAVGALNQAIGETVLGPAAVPMVVEPEPVEEAPPPRRSMKDPPSGRPLKRPI